MGLTSLLENSFEENDAIIKKKKISKASRRKMYSNLKQWSNELVSQINRTLESPTSKVFPQFLNYLSFIVLYREKVMIKD